MMKRVSLGIVIAALLVSAPRLTLAFILGDGIRVPEQIELGILTVTGVGSGIVLTIGNAVLAHALAVKAHQRSWLWWIEAAAWMLFLVGAVIVMAPTLVAGLEKSSLATVLPSVQSKWLWAVTAVVIVELLVGAAMAASILASEPVVHAPQPVSKSSLMSRFGEVLISRLEHSIAHPQQNGHHQELRSLGEQPLLTPSAETQQELVDESIPTEAASQRLTKRDALDILLNIYRQNPQASLRTVGQRIGRSPQTVSNYLEELQRQGSIRVNDNGVHVVQ